MFQMTEIRFNKIAGPIDPNFTETWKERWLKDLNEAFEEHGEVPPTLAFLADDRGGFVGGLDEPRLL